MCFNHDFVVSGKIDYQTHPIDGSKVHVHEKINVR